MFFQPKNAPQPPYDTPLALRMHWDDNENLDAVTVGRQLSLKRMSGQSFLKLYPDLCPPYILDIYHYKEIAYYPIGIHGEGTPQLTIIYKNWEDQIAIFTQNMSWQQGDRYINEIIPPFSHEQEPNCTMLPSCTCM